MIIISIKVADSIMGTGKTSAVISYINSHPTERYIYITPYLSEARRIKSSCKEAHFIEPSNKLKQHEFKKLKHTEGLIEAGKNVASTHQLFKHYTPDIIKGIKRGGYTLIVDENVDVLDVLDIHPNDMQMAIDAGYVIEDNGFYRLTDKTYEGTYFSELFSIIRTNHVTRVGNEDTTFFYWLMPPELITAFKEVIICTYMFSGQSLHHMLEMYNIPYEYIGVERDEIGGYRFGKYPGYIPEYVRDIKRKIHVLNHDKMNDIGDDYYALSMSWFSKSSENPIRLKKHIENYYKHLAPSTGPDKRLWATYNDEFGALRGKGYTKGFLSFNAKATNEYKNKNSLVYAVNLFQNVAAKIFFSQHGVKVDDDAYALSIMVQWIWRSAIRDGEEIDLYIPSRRMRELLVNWMDSLSDEEALSK